MATSETGKPRLEPEVYRPETGPHVNHLIYVRKRTPTKERTYEIVNVECVPCRERWTFNEYFDPKDDPYRDAPYDDEVTLEFVNGSYIYVPRKQK